MKPSPTLPHPHRKGRLLAPALSAALLASLGSVSAQNPSNPPESAANRNERQEARQQADRVLRTLEKEAAQIQDRAQAMQSKLDKMKVELNLSDLELAGNSVNAQGGETLRQLERSLIENRVVYSQIQGLHDQLKSKSKPELQQVVPTASPDTLLSHLMQNLADAEQKRVVLENQFSPQHPEMITQVQLIKKIDEQIEERIDGILAGLEVRSKSIRDANEKLHVEVEREKRRLIERSIEVAPVFAVKRELENLQLIQERIRLKIHQTQLDRALIE